MLRALEAAGCPLNYRTLRKYLERQPAPATPLGAALQARRAEQPAPPPELAPDDDLGRLARRRDEIDRALDAWQDQLSFNPAGVRAYRALSAELATLTRTLVELRPRPEAEHERLAALGAAARAELEERARLAQRPDEVSALRAENAELAKAVRIMRDALDAEDE